MKRHTTNKGGFAGLVLAVVFTGFLTRTTGAQDLGWIEWARASIATQYNITGGTLVLGETPTAPTYSNGPAPEVRSAESEELPFLIDNYWHFELETAFANWWEAGPRYFNVVPVETGDAALLIVLVRGEPINSPAAEVQFTMENVGEFTNSGLSVIQPLVSDWELKLVPFTFNQSLVEQDLQTVINYGLRSQSLDVLPPILINFGTSYSQELLEYLIANDGQAPLLANFSASAPRGIAPFRVDFDASTSTPSDGITNYSWDFGDGATASGATVSHTFTLVGQYEVTLTVTNAQGESDEFSRRVVVFDGIGLPESPLEIPFTSDAPVLDGTIDDVWSGAPTVDIAIWVAGAQAPVDEMDLSATARVLWDAQNLYVLYEVTDDALYNDSPNTYEDDAVDLYLDGGNEKTSAYDANDAQYEFGFNADTTTGNAVAGGLAEGVEFRYAQVSGGYVIEAAVPLENVGIPATPNTPIGIEFMVNDDDTQGNVRQTKLAWFSLDDVAFRDLGGAGTAVLVGGQGTILSPQFVPGEGQQLLVDVPVEFDASSSLAPSEITGYEWDFGDDTQGTGALVEHTYADTGSVEVTLTITYGDGLTATKSRTYGVVDGTGLPEKPLRIPLAESPPAIDGVLDPGWETGAASIFLTQTSAGTPDSQADLSATVYSMWDFNNLYIFYDVNDDILNGDSDNAWQDDSPEFMIDFGYERTFQGNDDNDRQYTFGWDHEELQGNVVDRAPNHGVEWTMSETETGYTLEARIPWSSASDVSPQMNQRIGFEPNANDADVEGDERASRLTWIDLTNNSYQYAHTLGSAQLVEDLLVAVEEENDELPSVFSIQSIYPNPFNPRTTAVLELPRAGEYVLEVYNVLGQRVLRRNMAVRERGRLEVGLDFAAFASGMYVISVEHAATGETASARAMLIK